MIGILILSCNEEKSDFSILNFTGSVCCPYISNTFFTTSESIHRDNELHIIPTDEESVNDSFSTPDATIPYFEEEEISSSSDPSQSDDLLQAPVSPDRSSNHNDSHNADYLKGLQAPLSSDQRELLAIHSKLKYLPFRHLQRLAKKGIIPRKFEKVEPPICPAS